MPAEHAWRAAQDAAIGITVLRHEKTNIPDNTATSVLRVTVPNANVSASILLRIITSIATEADAFEYTRAQLGTIAISRKPGIAAVAGAGSAGVVGTAASGSATQTSTTLGVTTATGAVNAQNTFDITIAIDGNPDNSHRCTIIAEMMHDRDGEACAMAPV